LVRRTVKAVGGKIVINDARGNPVDAGRVMLRMRLRRDYQVIVMAGAGR